jgi:predicted dehydrogenase
MTFENGYINLDGILSSTNSYSPERLLYGYRDMDDDTSIMGKPFETISSFKKDDSWSLELKEFISAVKGNGDIQNGTFEDAYNLMSLIDEIYEKKE